MTGPRFLLTACLPLALAACGGGNAPPAATATSQSRTNTSEAEAEATIGKSTLHVTAVQTSQLPESVARQYGIERSPRRILLLANLRELGTGAAPSISATVTDLQGHTTPVTLRALTQADPSTVDYVGTIDATLPDTLRFQVIARRGAAMASVQMSRDFYPE